VGTWQRTVWLWIPRTPIAHTTLLNCCTVKEAVGSDGPDATMMVGLWVVAVDAPMRGETVRWVESQCPPASEASRFLLWVRSDSTVVPQANRSWMPAKPTPRRPTPAVRTKKHRPLRPPTSDQTDGTPQDRQSKTNEETCELWEKGGKCMKMGGSLPQSVRDTGWTKHQNVTCDSRKNHPPPSPSVLAQGREGGG